MSDCSIKINISGKEYQSISENLIKNFDLKTLEKKISENGYENETIYYYYLTTVKFKQDENIFRQTGSGPNLEGNVVTLCTCKHFMRTYKNIQKGIWIAGITNKENGNYLFYLFKIDEIFYSQFELSEYLKETSAFFHKSSVSNRLGDLYIPTNKCKDENQWHNPNFYNPPPKNHVHFENDQWHKDIRKETLRYGDQPQKLLLGNSSVETFSTSFVWDEPMLKLNIPPKFARGQRKTTLEKFIKLFRDK